MKIVCPICGKDDTSGFLDKELHTQGMHCNSCNADFGVDDGKKINEYQKLLTDFSYSHKDKEGTVKEIYIHRIKDTVTLTPSIIEKGVLQPYSPIDISPMFDKLTDLFFNKVYILDWVSPLTGLILDKNETYKIEMKFSMNLLPDIKKEGTNKFPPYLVVLEKLFDSFFIEENKDNGSK
jgi:hypothetical protein